MTAYLIAALIILCIILSGLFSASEMAYSSCNKVRLQNLCDDGDKKAARAIKIAERFEDALSAILIGNNLVNIASSSLGSVFVILVVGDDSFTWLSSVVITVLVIIFGETIPKITAKKNATTLSMRYSGFIRTLMTVFSPLVFIVVKLVHLLTFKMPEVKEDAEESVEELQSIIETAEDEGILDEDQTQLVQAAIDFSEVCAFEVMTARVDVQAIDIDDPLEKILQFIAETPYSRIPVYRESIDNIIGVLHLNRFLKAFGEEGKQTDIGSLLMPPCYVYKTMKLPTVLKSLKNAKQHLAIVTDEYSGTLGVVSMEDVLESIVGEIWDENDVIEEDVLQKKEGEYEIDGDLAIGDFLETIGINESEFEFQSDTVGGWVVEMLEHFPSVSDSFTYLDFEVSVLAVDGLRVEKVLVKELGRED